jgi:hypothetical protein
VQDGQGETQEMQTMERSRGAEGLCLLCRAVWESLLDEAGWAEA